MCCKGESHTAHGWNMNQCGPHAGMAHGECGCGCSGRKYLSKKEKIEMLEEYKESLMCEIDGVEEELKALREE